MGGLGAARETLIVRAWSALARSGGNHSAVTEGTLNRPSCMWVSTITPEGRIQRMTRHRHGHGSLLRGDAVALPHIGYWIVEQRNASMCVIAGNVRGDVQVLESLNRAGQQLLLILDNGTRLPIVLRERGTGGLTWEFTSMASSPIELVSSPPPR